MLRKILFICFIFLNMALFSQSLSKNFELNWSSIKDAGKLGNKGIKEFSFNGAVYNGKRGIVPSFRYEVALKSDEEIGSVELLEKKFSLAGKPVNSFDSPLFEAIKEDIIIQVHYRRRAGQKFAQIEFIPIKRDLVLHTFSLLRSFQLQITYQHSIQKNAQLASAFANSSVLSLGDWYKFSVDKSGIFKISGTDLQNAGINISNLNPDKIGVYGFGGMLNEKNADFRYDDLPELAIQLVGVDDGKFDPEDYLLFYAQGPDVWKYNKDKNVFEHKLNIYSRKSFYFVHIGAENGKRISSVQEPTVAANFQADAFTDYAFVEDETYNLIGTGRRWLGDKFEFVNTKTYDFNFENLLPGGSAYVKAELVARSTATSSFDLSYNGQSLGAVNISKIPSGSYPSYAYDGTFESYFELSNDAAIAIDINYNRPLSSAIGWLDYLEINVKRKLEFGNQQLAFRCPESIGEGNITEFTIQSANASTQVWDISTLDQVELIDLKSQNNSSLFKAKTDQLREFIAFTPEMAYNPVFVEKVEPQNLHALADVDMLIVCPTLFLSQANELADFHREEGLTVEVVSLDKIYNEFSSGAQDVSAIRDFVRSVYTHSNQNNPLKYLLLFGDASYDYLEREDNNTNRVPTYEAQESFDPITSIAVDDYFGFLGDDEGDMYYDDVDIGIGRLPVVTKEEADDAVQKIIRYASADPAVFGDWRNGICFVADDEDNNLHIRQADQLADLVDTIFPAGNLDKIYADAFQQVSTPAGQRYPKVNEAINERVEKGSLILSYTGHGGETGWGQERYLDMPDIESWSNFDRLPVFLTATCEFARYDDPKRVSAGETIFLSKKGGGIALFTTSRATYAGSNFVISRHFYNNALNHPDHHYLRMGDILKLTKRASGSGFNVMKFVLLGDPALKLSIPKNFTQITHINEKPINDKQDTIKALSYVHIQGQIVNPEGNRMDSFNGFVYPLVYDKSSEITTLANDNGSQPFTFSLQKNILYKGKAEVVNGLFEFSFVVPKDIAYQYGMGKISLYASSDTQDAEGYKRDLVIGGFDENSETDNRGPDIKLYLNNENFVEGGLTSQNPILLAKVSDKNGINTIGNGIGHDITAFLDGNGADIKILNDYYVSDLNTFKSGTIQYPFFNLEDGEHELSFKVWDIYNNSSTAKLKFYVASSASLALEAVMNYPNPFSDETIFSFEQNAGEQNLNIQIDIYSLSGKLVKHIEDDFLSYSSRVNHIHWDGTDDHGSKISKGMYIYRLQLTDENGDKKSKTAKLVYLK
jgi:hypothetical protein